MAPAQSIENNQHECFVVTQCCRVGYRGCFVMKECAFISLRVSLPMTCFYNTLIISIIRFLPAVEMTGQFVRKIEEKMAASPPSFPSIFCTNCPVISTVGRNPKSLINRYLQISVIGTAGRNLLNQPLSKSHIFTKAIILKKSCIFVFR